MNIAKFSVNRPVTTSMIFLGVLLLGAISLSLIPQELFPPITYPQLTIVTSYPNAAPEEVETLLTKIIEEAVGTVKGLKRISSTSREGMSIVMAEFMWNQNMDFAALGVREKIDLIKERLPRDAEEPIVIKYNPFMMPVMIFSVTGKVPSYELLDFTRRVLKDKIEKVDGVASATVSGGLEREILVEVDAAKLAASHLGIVKVVEALRDSNLNYPAGTTKEKFYEYLIRTIGEFKTVSDVKETVVSSDKREHISDMRYQVSPQDRREDNKKEKRLIYLKDIAEIKDTFKERSSYSRYNGRENVSMLVQKQTEANTIRTVKRIRKALKDFQENVPEGININVVYDQSIFIKEAINGVKDAAISGGILAFFVLLFFLRNIKNAVIVTGTIPVSIMAAFSLMYFNGLTINLMSLGGLALGVGMLVDNSIVVVENIFRHKQDAGYRMQDTGNNGAGAGFKPALANRTEKASIITGTAEVSGAIFSSTLTTVAVFLPMIFVVGVAGQLFKELAFTVTFSLIASLVVALSLIPRLSMSKDQAASRRLQAAGKTKKQKAFSFISIISAKFKNIFAPLHNVINAERMYTKVLKIFLDHKLIGLFLVFILFMIGLTVLFGIDKEFLPKIDQGQFMVNITLLTGTRLEVTDNITKEIEREILSLPETKNISVNVGSEKERSKQGNIKTLGSHQSQIMVELKKNPVNIFNLSKSLLSGKRYEKKYKSTEEVIQYLKSIFDKEYMQGAKVEYIMQGSILQSSFETSAPVVIEIKGPNLTTLREIVDKMQNKLADIKGIYGIKNSFALPAPETKVNINRDRAAQYNLNVKDIALASQIAIKGYVATKFKEEGREIDIKVRLREKDRNNFEKLRNLSVHSPADIELPLKEVAFLARGKGPSEIKRLDQQKVILISANIFGRSFSDVAEDINKMINRMQIAEDYSVILAGENEQLKASFKSLKFALILAFLLVYMIMAGQFESLWQPFIIMGTVPLSLIGVSGALLVTNTSLNVISFLGIIMLGGIVVNNGIVLISYINDLRKSGMQLREAVEQASRVRLRPILMTTMTTLLGLVPLALGIGEGAELRSPLAITVMGGLLISTFLTLVVIPAIYLLVARYMPALKAEPSLLEETIKTTEIIEEKPVIEKIQFDIKKVDIKLTARQKKLLTYLQEKGKITRKEYAEKFKLSIPTAARDLKVLTDKNLIEGKGPLGPGRWYEKK